MIVERALLPGHGLDGAWHGRGFQRRGAVRVEGVANGVDGGEGPLGGQRESVLVLWLQGGGGTRRTAELEKRTEQLLPDVKPETNPRPTWDGMLELPGVRIQITAVTEVPKVL